MKSKKTKIIATIGPSSESMEVLEKLIQEGVNVFRFNLKHNDFEWHKNKIKKVKEISEKLGKKIGIMIDLQGPEIRLETENSQEIDLKEGDSVFIANKFIKGKKTIRLNPGAVLKQIDKGDSIFIDDGDGEFRVINKKFGVVEMKSERNYVIKHRKSLNIPGKKLDLPLFSKKDLDALEIVDQFNADFAALSFVRGKDDIEALRKKLSKIGPKIKIVAKIENASAIKNIEEIIESTDAVMVARGDLGVEIPLRELAYWQKKIVDLCRQNNKPVIVATQMLKSMVNNYRPTRAEVTDVSNAIFDGTDAVMLSEETASGKYPEKSVEQMASIAIFCEEHGVVNHIEMENKTTTEILVNAAVKIVTDNNVIPFKAIVVFTKSGKTARIFSKYRLNIPIIAFTENSEIVESLTMSYGVNAYLKKFNRDDFNISTNLVNELNKFDFIEKGDNILMIHGNGWMKTGSTADISLVTI
ncbi:MAG: pyruvate kinase [Candidatus Shapirobacteria bacterium]